MEQQSFAMNYKIDPDNIFSQVDCLSKKRALEIISHRASELLEVPVQDIFEGLFNREKMGCTHIGCGIAIPHCQLDYDFEPCIIILQLQKNIGFDCIDESAVDLIFAIIFPKDHDHEHSGYLQQLQEKLSDKTTAKMLKNAADQKQLYDLINQLQLISSKK